MYPAMTPSCNHAITPTCNDPFMQHVIVQSFHQAWRAFEDASLALRANKNFGVQHSKDEDSDAKISNVEN